MDRILDILNDEGSGREINLLKNESKKEKKVKKLVVKPLFNDEDDYGEPPHPHLLRLPFSLLEIAPKGSGKTVLLQNMLVWYFNYFDNIFIWSPTINLDVKWRKIIDELQIPEENLFTSYNENEVTMIMHKIRDFNNGKENKEKIRCLFIMDDIVEQLPKGMKVSTLNKLAMNHRHFNISHIIISQSFKKLDPVVRLNTTGVILFNTDNVAERKKIIEELCGNLGHRKFEDLYMKTISEKYSFLYINYDSRKIYKNFTTEIGDLNVVPDRMFK